MRWLKTSKSSTLAGSVWPRNSLWMRSNVALRLWNLRIHFKFPVTHAACIAAEGLNLQSALVHSKHEIKPGNWTWTLSVHIFTLLCCLTSSGISLTSPALCTVREQPLTLSQCSWTGTAARRQARLRFTMCCDSSTRTACCPTCSHPVGAAADKPDTLPHSHASLPTAHCVRGILSSVVHHTRQKKESNYCRRAMRLRHRLSAPVCLRGGGRQPSA